MGDRDGKATSWGHGGEAHEFRNWQIEGRIGSVRSSATEMSWAIGSSSRLLEEARVGRRLARVVYSDVGVWQYGKGGRLVV